MLVALGSWFTFGWRWRAMNAYRKDVRIHRTFHAEIEETGIVVATDTSSSKYSWKDVMRVKENNSLFLLYHGPRKFQAFPKRAFTSEQADEFRALLTQYGPKRKEGVRAVSMQTWVFIAVIVASALLLLRVILASH